MKRYTYIVFFLFILLLFGCSNDSSSPNDSNTTDSNAITEEDTTKPEIKGLSNIQLTYEYGNEMPDWLNGITAEDNKDGDLTSQIEVDSSEVNMEMEGTYSVTYTVSDNSGNPTVETITVTIQDTQGPEINGTTNYTLEVFTSEKPNWLNNISASDTKDGDRTSNITVNDSDVKLNVIGEYEVVFTVQDTNGNITTEKIKVNIKDSVSPTILGLTDKSIEENSNITIDWLTGVTGEDNYDGVITNDITIDDSNVIYNQPGEYIVYYNLEDQSGNSTQEQVILTVLDEEGSRQNPILFGNSYIISSNDFIYGDYKIQVTINSNTRGEQAENIILNENMFNDPSGINNEYVLTNITIKLLEIDETSDYYQNYGFDNWTDINLVTLQGKMYDTITLAVIPNDLNDCSLFKGNSCTGNIVNLVDDAETLILKYVNKWFKVSNEELNYVAPDDEDTNSNYGTQSNPVPLGDSQVIEVNNIFDEYKVKITINNVIRGQQAEDIILNENMFNDPSGDLSEYIIVNYTITLLSADEADEYYSECGFNDLNDFDFVSKSSGIYNDTTYAVVPNEITDYALFVGGTATGNIAHLVDDGDQVLLKWGTMWFSLN